MNKSGHKKTHTRRKPRGIALAWVVIFILLIILFVGLTLDTGKVYLVSHQLQNAADAAALAGGRVVKLDPNDARQFAVDIALANYASGDPVQLDRNDENLPEGDVIIGRYDTSEKTFTPNTTVPNALKVVARRTENSLGGTVPLLFGPIVNVDTANIERYAIAIAVGGTGAGLIALAPDGIGLLLNGTLDLTVNDGAIQVNSADDNAMRIVGTPDINAEEVDIWGDYVGAGYEFPPPPEIYVDTESPPIPDPLCPYWPPVTGEPSPDDCLQGPYYDISNDLSPKPGEAIKITGDSHVLEPGYYSGGFEITGGDVVLKPGIYVLDSSKKAGLVIGGNANFCAKGVMFYIMGDARVDIGGTGVIEIDPLEYEPELGSNYFCDPSYSYPAGMETEINYYEGMSIFQERGNTNEASILGTSIMDLTGTLYFPTNHVEIGGTGDGFGNQIIAWSMDVHGTGEITINYDGRNRAPANRAYLIE